MDKSREWVRMMLVKYWSDDYEDGKKYFKAEGIELVYPSGEEKAKLLLLLTERVIRLEQILMQRGIPGQRSFGS